MKVITELTGKLGEAEYREPRGLINMLHFEPSPGVHVQIGLGSAGLLIRRGAAAAALPLDAITKLVFEQCPEIISTETLSPAAKFLAADKAKRPQAKVKNAKQPDTQKS